jgi:hypothetical protein
VVCHLCRDFVLSSCLSPPAPCAIDFVISEPAFGTL